MLLLITATVIPLMMILVGSYAEEHPQRQWTALSRLGASFLDAVQGLTTLKAFGRSAAESERVAAASEEFRGRTMKVLRYAFLSEFVLEIMPALVGRSGSGKSTLVNLLMRFVDPEAGEIRTNGVAIVHLPVEAWRKVLALVPQRSHPFYGSVCENIRLARPTASLDEVERAAELVGAAEFIRRLPNGCIVERGTHEQLVGAQGVYRQMLDLQRGLLATAR